jgi:1-deoxy-D-xylulose-5-phosphate reductoisomerase
MRSGVVKSTGTLRGVAILGSTGSIGTAALRVLARHRNQFKVVALTAYGNTTLLRKQVEVEQPQFVGIVSNGETNGDGWNSGPECLIAAATRDDVDIVLNAVVGAAGLQATMAALMAGKRVALANKESLVVGGELLLAARDIGGGEIVPVDSEHSAILQCLCGRPASSVRRIILTASGGPFRGWGREQLKNATIEDALRHPTWRMGRKITVDSATLANKALEVIEAHYLFGLPYDAIDVVVHPQSLVHSFVEFVDGSVVAQIGIPSMELPILYALTHPDRLHDDDVPRFDPVTSSPMTYESVVLEDFPALGLGIEAGRLGGVAPAVFNAANEQAVALFLDGKITFPGIADTIQSALGALANGAAHTLDDLLTADAMARQYVSSLC